MLTPDNFIAQLRDKLSITDIIGKRVIWDTKKTNAKNGVFWACCPFHLEKTASFKVDQNKGFFYCFGCHEKGDSISFVMKTENLDFLTTVKRLATEVGLKLPISFGNNTFHKSESYLNVLKIQEIASFYFRDLLKNNPSKNATLFLKNRISNNEIIQNFP